MNTQQIANRLVELCKKGDFKGAQSELFAKDAVSIEQHESPAFPKETKGLDAIRQKAETWDKMVQETHSMNISEPLVAGSSFSVKMDMDMTLKGREREKMSELAVYETKDGKIVSERFFM